MNKSLEQQVNKGSDIVFKFYKDYMLKKINIKNKRVLLIGIGNTRFISLIKQQAKRVCVIDNNQPFIENFELIDIIQLKKDIVNFLKENKMPKFDVAIMNPPYSDGKKNKDIDLKIISKCVNISDVCIAIAPTAAIADFYRILGDGKKADYNSKSNIDYKNVCETKLKNLTILNMLTANKIFGANFQNKIGIFTFNNDNTEPVNTFDFVIHNTIFDKIIVPLYNNKIESILSAAEKSVKTKYGCELREHHGNSVGTLDYFKITAKNYVDACFVNGKSISNANGILNYYFNTENELINFYNYINLPIIKYIHSLTKTNMRTRRQFIPDFGNYNKKITTKMVCKKFNLTGYISDTEAEKDSEWETILNTMKEYV